MMMATPPLTSVVPVFVIPGQAQLAVDTPASTRAFSIGTPMLSRTTTFCLKRWGKLEPGDMTT